MKATAKTTTTPLQNLILRSTAFAFFLTSLIVMLKSKTRSSHGSTKDLEYRFTDYKPFRFVVAVDLLGCLYSFMRVIQILSGITGGFCFYLSCIVDQVMSYIILSSVSAGIGCIMLTKEFLQDGNLYGAAAKKFLRFALASVCVEVLGFFIIAFCAVISGYNLSCYLSSPTVSTVSSEETPDCKTDTKQQSNAC
ncbi:CASP-like protein 3A1 [Cryptomeria japonica]|uniref:CASP-like protein 3A1 n=1 Tax=Cryptomeria japonica TaxID=3369 RepID=UPI0027DA00B6|nr:CASP-like protein 3A1 [Cryptomeria japonica]